MNNRNKKVSGANKNIKTRRDNGRLNFANWFYNHKIALIDSFKTLYQAPISNLLTIFILGIALALPLLLYLIISNANSSLNSWQESFYQYSVYLDSSYTEQKAANVKSKIYAWPEIANIEMITKDKGLKELKTTMGIADVLTNIEHNPLPIVLIIDLKPEYYAIENIKNLIAKSNSITGVAKAEADIFVLEKISKILQLFYYVSYIFSIALGLAVLLVIANTIRLTLKNKQKEMTVFSLLGATNAYIRRPYLYGGIFYGLFAGVIALIVTKVLFYKLYNMVSELGYVSLINLEIIGYSSTNLFMLLVGGCVLGWLGARITLALQLKQLKGKLAEI